MTGRPTSSRPTSRDDRTVPIASGEQSWIELARYRMRANAHRIVAECEWLHAELDRTAYDAWRDTVGRALLAARRLQSALDRGASHANVPGLHAIRAAIAAPQREIVDALTSFLTLIPLAPAEEMMLNDVRAIRELAIGLMVAGEELQQPSPSAVTKPGLESAVVPTDVTEMPALVLAVDDEPQVRELLSRLLGRLGYRATLAADGREGFDVAERETPDLIITDLSMPGMGGIGLLAQLKASERTRHIPVIVVSGEGDADSVVKCLEHGAEDHLTKPYSAMVLQTRIRMLLERKRLRDVELAHLRRVTQLTAAAEAVERLAYDRRLLDGLLTRTDALGQLARVFDRMVGGIRSREELLEARLHELRLEIERASGTRPIPIPDLPSLELTIPVEHSLAPEQLFAGRYEIKRELGKGGMGVVYLAHDRELGEDVAVKIVRRDVIGMDATLRDRLKTEIRLARRVSHRNIVRAYDLGESEGSYYFTMEFVAGVTVADLIASRGRLSVESTIAIGIQLAEALAAAHALEIIHRDIKPENLMVDPAGVLKVADFGLARPVQRAVRLTLGGHVVGTPAYMAPEQMLGGALDARTDLFSAGVALYECLSGQLPSGSSDPVIILARMSDPPPPLRSIVPAVPAALETVIERLLQRDPANRFQSARELAEHLERIASV